MAIIANQQTSQNKSRDVSVSTAQAYIVYIGDMIYYTQYKSQILDSPWKEYTSIFQGSEMLLLYDSAKCHMSTCKDIITDNESKHSLVMFSCPTCQKATHPCHSPWQKQLQCVINSNTLPGLCWPKMPVFSIKYTMPRPDHAWFCSPSSVRLK